MSQEVYKVVRDCGAGQRGIFWSWFMRGRHALCYRLGKPTKARFGGVLVYDNLDDAQFAVLGSPSNQTERLRVLRGIGEEPVELPRRRGPTNPDGSLERRWAVLRRWVWRHPESCKCYTEPWPLGSVAFKTFTPVEVVA